MNELLKLNDQLYGAPTGVLVGAFAIALGYLLRTLPFFNNRYIPLTVVGFCTVVFMLAAPARAADVAERTWLVRNFALGFIIGFGAWAFHAQILKRFVDPNVPFLQAKPDKPEEPK